jgi:hypothetical protein
MKFERASVHEHTLKSAKVKPKGVLHVESFY